MSLLTRREFCKLSAIVLGGTAAFGFLAPIPQSSFLQPTAEAFNPLGLNVGLNLKQELLAHPDNYRSITTMYHVGEQVVAQNRSNLTSYKGSHPDQLPALVAKLVGDTEKDKGYAVLDVGPGVYSGLTTSENLGIANSWGARYPLVVSMDIDKAPYDTLVADRIDPHLGLHSKGESYGFGFACKDDINLLPAGASFDKVTIIAPSLRSDMNLLFQSAFAKVKKGGYFVLVPDPDINTVPLKLNSLYKFILQLKANGYSVAEITALSLTAKDIYLANQGQLATIPVPYQPKIIDAKGIGSIASGFLPWIPGEDPATSATVYSYDSSPLEVYMIKKNDELINEPEKIPDDIKEHSLDELLNSPLWMAALAGAAGLGLAGLLGRKGPQGGGAPPQPA